MSREIQQGSPLPLSDPPEARLEGRRAVQEALEAGKPIDKLYVQRGAEGLSRIIAQAIQAGGIVVDTDRAVMDQKSITGRHQGIIATLAAFRYATLDELFSRAESRGEKPLLVICDGLEDPHNLGAVIRSAEAAGAHGVIIAKRRGVGLTAVTARTSAGAALHLPVCRVPGIPAVLPELQARGVWIYGLDADGGTSVFDADLRDGTALVLGAEGTGMSRLVRERCDFLLSIPMRGKVSSLNVSAAAAITLYQAVRCRTGPG